MSSSSSSAKNRNTISREDSERSGKADGMSQEGADKKIVVPGDLLAVE